mmetsp:Transcript_13342/g.16215  ORF Transcript_13342/g.16215 Transcript_13342/m.16215 type:complete len:87 (+) Transcript_13342:72-332(+)
MIKKHPPESVIAHDNSFHVSWVDDDTSVFINDNDIDTFLSAFDKKTIEHPKELLGHHFQLTIFLILAKISKARNNLLAYTRSVWEV